MMMTERDPANWSLKAKIGQLVMCGFEGSEPTEGILELIREYALGGIIYFRRNVGTAEQTARLSARLREAAGRVTDVPLWIAVDQEGGMVARIDRGVTVMPGNMALGAAREPSFAYRTAHASGADLLRMGINMNLAPCLDVNCNPANPVIGVRSYGERPELVGELGAAAIRGFQEAGVAACAKHFPGHGDTEADSHRELPIVPHGRERLAAVELAPFRRAIAEGVDAIMTAHVLFPAYDDSGVPATISERILGGLLRRELGYDGVIVTDCLEMNAISETVGIGRGAVMAVKAGADVVLVSHRLDRQREALEALIAAVESGELDEARIDESVRRIVSMKARRRVGAATIAAGGAAAATAPAGEGTDGGAAVSGDAAALGDAAVGSLEADAVAREAYAGSVTLVKQDDGALPLKRDVPTLAIWPEVRLGTEVDEVIDHSLTLAGAVGRYVKDVEELVIGIEPTDDEIAAVLAAAAGRPQIIAGTYNASFSPGQIALVRALMARGDCTVIAVSLRNPYDLLAFPDVHAYASCYENRPLALEALAAVLAGEAPARGKLPVSLGERYPYGYGL